MNTPCFPAFRQKLAALGRRTADRPRPASPIDVEAQCKRFLSGRALDPPDDGPRPRRRLFFLSRVFWCFVWQALQPRTSCRAAVREVQAFCETSTRRFDESSSAYCQARLRLPESCLRNALADSAAARPTACPFKACRDGTAPSRSSTAPA